MAITADSVIVELDARTGGFDAKVRGSSREFGQSMSQIERSAVQAERSLVRLSDQGGFAVRNLGFQVGDIGQQLAGGSSPFLIFAQQGPQVSAALQEISASGATLGAVLRGIALPGMLAIVSVLGSLVASSLQVADANDEHKKAVQSLSDAIRDMEAASKGAISTTQREIFLARANAEIQYAAAIATRERTKATLALAQAQLQANEAAVGRGAPSYVNAGGRVLAAQAQVDALQRQIDAQTRDIERAEASRRRTQTVINQQSVEESLDAATAATNRYNRQLDLLNRRAEQGKVSESQYEAELRNLIQTRDRQLESAREAERQGRKTSDATRAAAKAERERAREVKKAAQELENFKNELQQVRNALDPAAASADELAKSLNTIGRAQLRGLIGQADAALLAFRALRRESDAIGERRNQQFNELFGTDDPFAEITKEATARFEANQDATLAVEEQARRVREDNIREAAYMYQDLFRGGTKAVWRDFKELGFRILADLLARWTVGGPGGGGGAGDFVGSLGHLLGFASGGSIVVGGRGGIDQNVMSINGQPVARVNKGETISVHPNAAIGAGITKVFNINVSANNSVTPAGFARGLASEILHEARRMDERAAHETLRAAPAALARTQRYGTTV